MPRGFKKSADATEQRTDAGTNLSDNKPEERNTNAQGGVSPSGTIPTISPLDLSAGTGAASANDGSGDSSATGRRGRKPGSKNRTTETKTAEDLIGDLQGLLYGGHCMLAALAKCPEFELEEEEAKRLAEASMKVMKHYEYTVNPTTLAWCQLGFVGLQVYGPRVALIMNKKPEAKPVPVVAATKPVAPLATIPSPKRNLPPLTNPSQLDNSEPIESFGE